MIYYCCSLSDHRGAASLHEVHQHLQGCSLDDAHIDWNDAETLSAKRGRYGASIALKKIPHAVAIGEVVLMEWIITFSPHDISIPESVHLTWELFQLVASWLAASAWINARAYSADYISSFAPLRPLAIAHEHGFVLAGKELARLFE